MDFEVHAAKHLGVKDRERRFDATSKFGGRGGHTLSIARPRSHVREPCSDISASGPGLSLDLHGAAALRRAAELEASGVVKSVARNPECPDVIMTTYLAEPGGDELTVSRPTAAANTRRYPLGFDMVHMGCSRCGKNRGMCGRFKRGLRQQAERVRRHGLRQQLAAAFGEEAAGDACTGSDGAAVDLASTWPTGARRAAARWVGGAGGGEAGAAVPPAPAPALEREDSWVVVDAPQVLRID